MTRQQQNEIIIKSLGNSLADMPNVQDRIANAFTDWFQALVKQGVELLAPPAPVEEQGGAAPQEG